MQKTTGESNHGLTRFHYEQIILGAGVYLADGAEIIMLGAVSKTLAQEFRLSEFTTGLMVALVYSGTLLANLVSGRLSDKFGRRPVLLLSYAGVFAASLLSLLCSGPLSLGSARFFCGFFFGMGGPAWNALAAEISPINRRTWVSALGLCLFGLGEAFSCGVLVLGDFYPSLRSWRVLLALSAVPAGILFVLAKFRLKESPVYLSSKAAERVSGPSSGLTALFGSSFIYTTATLAVLAFTLNFAFYGALYALPQDPEKFSPVNMALSGLIEIPGYILGGLVGIKMRRKLLLEVFLLVSLGCTACMLLPELLHAGVYSWKFFSSVGWLALYLYTAEVFDTEVRSSGSGLVMAIGRLGAISAPIVFELVGQYNIYIICGLLGTGALLVPWLPVETQNRRLDAE